MNRAASLSSAFASERTTEPAIELGNVGTFADLAPLASGDRDPTFRKELQQRLGLAPGFALGDSLVIRALQVRTEERSTSWQHGKCLSKAGAEGAPDQVTV